MSLKVSLPSWTYSKVPSGFNVSSPCAESVTKETINTDPSASESLANTLLPASVAPSSSSYSSPSATGASFTGVIVNTTSTISESNSPSFALYVNVSLTVSLPSWTYSKVPFGFSVSSPCSGPVTKAAVRADSSASASLTNTLLPASVAPSSSSYPSPSATGASFTGVIVNTTSTISESNSPSFAL